MILEINNLNKTYSDFKLNNINLSIYEGTIMGFIGENGAGKTTTIKLILDMLKKDSGTIKIFDKDLDSNLNKKYIKNYIAPVFNDFYYPTKFNIKDLESVLSRIYENWDHNDFYNYMNLFDLPVEKQIGLFSSGMKVKLSLAVALSHKAKFIIIDEAFSNLDSIVRDDLLLLLRKYVRDGKNAVLISSHIIQDIEKISDEITFIQKGNIVFSDKSESIYMKYSILNCTKEEIQFVNKNTILKYYLDEDNRYSLLLEGNEKKKKVNLEQMIKIYVKGESLQQNSIL